MNQSLPALLGFLLAIAPAAQAQFGVATNNGTITITGYSGPGGDVTIPETIDGLPVTSIGDSAFDGASLTRITIPDGIVYLGSGAFEGCTNLCSVLIGNSVGNIENEAFDGDTSLTSVTLGNSVTNIGSVAFEGCMTLASVTIPNSVTTIREYAFDGCYSLASVYFKGNAPVADETVFDIIDLVENPTAYFLPGTTNWSAFSAKTGVPVMLWHPLIQTGDADFGVRTNQFGFNINWASGQTVVVEACTNLANPVWLPVATNTLTSDSSYFSDPQWSNYPARFYRLRSP